MNDECIICKAPLMYLETDELMECNLCHNKEMSKTRCVNGHYVCNSCHTRGMDSIIAICLASNSKNPIEILRELMAQPFCHMHGPEHHVMVGSALLTAYKNSGGDIDLERSLIEMQNRGKQVPGGACGFWGACGAGISAGMFISIITKSTPLANEAWGLSNKMTSRALDRIGEVGGPRCCKRDSYLSILAAIEFVRENLGIEMESSDIICTHSGMNNQCIGGRCPFGTLNRIPKVAFICVHNSCRSQIAEALGRHLAADVFESFSAGTETKPEINKDAVRLVREIYGIDMSTQHSKLIGDIPTPDIAISMGCNVGCPFIGRDFDDNWGLEDPTGKSDAEFRLVIAQIEKKIIELRDSLA